MITSFRSFFTSLVPRAFSLAKPGKDPENEVATKWHLVHLSNHFLILIPLFKSLWCLIKFSPTH